MEKLAESIVSGDGIANAAIREAGQRITELSAANGRMKAMLARIAYPSRGTSDETADACAFASEIQEAWTLEDLSENTKDQPPSGSAASDCSEI